MERKKGLFTGTLYRTYSAVGVWVRFKEKQGKAMGQRLINFSYDLVVLGTLFLKTAAKFVESIIQHDKTNNTC